MKNISIIALAAILSTFSGPVFSQTEAPEKLVELTVDEPSTPGGKPLKMSFTEIQRESDNSIVEVVFISGASVPSSMFILKGMCAVMRSRAESYFKTERVGSNLSKYKVTFPKNPSDLELTGKGKRVFSEQDCSMLRL